MPMHDDKRLGFVLGKLGRQGVPRLARRLAKRLLATGHRAEDRGSFDRLRQDRDYRHDVVPLANPSEGASLPAPAPIVLRRVKVVKSRKTFLKSRTCPQKTEWAGRGRSSNRANFFSRVAEIVSVSDEFRPSVSCQKSFFASFGSIRRPSSPPSPGHHGRSSRGGRILS